MLSPVTSIPIPARLTPHETGAWIGTWAKVLEQPDLHLALPADAQLDCAAVVLLAAGIGKRRSLGMRTWMHAEDGRALRFLQDVDFLRELEVDADVEPARAPAGRAVPLRRIANLDVARRQADATRALFERVVPSMPPSTIRAAQFVFEELAANVVQHSAAPQTGFGMASADPGTKRVQIAFADAGVGFLESLSSNPEFSGRIADDAEAIRLALDRRVGRAASGNIGMGLFLLSTFADRVQGDLWIATGNAMLVRRSGEGGRRDATYERTAGWRGAFLCLDAPVPGW